MNAFYEHHRDSVRWHYRCFDRILLNGPIQPFQQPEGSSASSTPIGGGIRSLRQLLHGIADHFQKWLKSWAPNRLQELADSLTAQDLVACGQKWLARLTNANKIRVRAPITV
jgi:hypothetical protein